MGCNETKFFISVNHKTQWEDPRLQNPEITGPVSIASISFSVHGCIVVFKDSYYRVWSVGYYWVFTFVIKVIKFCCMQK